MKTTSLRIGFLLSLILSISLLFSQTPLWNRAWQSDINTHLITGELNGAGELWLGGSHFKVTPDQPKLFHGPYPYLAATDSAGNLLWDKHISWSDFPNISFALEEVTRIRKAPSGNFKALIQGWVACDIYAYGMILASYDGQGNLLHHFTRSQVQPDDTFFSDFWMLPDERVVLSGYGYTYPTGSRSFLYLVTADGRLIRAMDLSQLEQIHSFHAVAPNAWLISAEKGIAIIDSLGLPRVVGLFGKKILDFLPWYGGEYLAVSQSQLYRLDSQLLPIDSLSLHHLGPVNKLIREGQHSWVVGKRGVARLDSSFLLGSVKASSFSPHFEIHDLRFSGNRGYALGKWQTSYFSSAGVLPFLPNQTVSYPQVDIALDNITKHKQIFTNPPYEYDIAFQIWVSNVGQDTIQSFDVQAYLGHLGFCDSWGFHQGFNNTQLAPGQQKSFVLSPIYINLHYLSLPTTSTFILANPNQQFDMNPANNSDGFISTSLESEKSLELKLFPQPARDLLRLEAEKPFHRLRMMDLQGRIVWEDRFAPAKQGEIRRGNWSAGIYLLEVHAGDRSHCKKVIWE
jgi:hypothetical protein